MTPEQRYELHRQAELKALAEAQAERARQAEKLAADQAAERARQDAIAAQNMYNGYMNRNGN